MDDDHERLLTRRRLLASGAVAAVSFTVLDTSVSAKTWTAGPMHAAPLPHYARKGLRRSRFAPHVGTPVKLRPRGGAAVRGTLAGIDDVPNVASLAGDKDAYTLRLRGPASPLIAEGIVGVRHKHFGVVELYVTAVPGGVGSQDYLATINRRVPRGARRSHQR